MVDLPSVTVTAKAEKALRGGHPWVYEGEVLSCEGCASGELCHVFSLKGKWLGTGFFNENSKLRVRVISKNANDRFDEAFWRRRVRHAIDYRKTVMGEDFSCCRLIFGEADFFPGLTVDKFGGVLSVQCLSLGIEKLKDIIYGAVLDILREYGEEITVLYERNDSAIRRLEGMECTCGYYPGEGLCNDTEETVITENGIKYYVNFRSGQKTGFFLDQKYNRRAASKIAPGKRVLDCFTHTGAFALNAAAAGASHVTAVDISADAIEAARRNARLNGLENRLDFVCTDVFDLLTELQKSKKREYDYIILDPPAFTKSSSTVKNAVKGYREINTAAMCLLPPGGYLATCSCSHFMRDSLFREMLHAAASDAGAGLRQVEARQQSPDHPVLWNVPETDYLKFYIFQIIK